MNLKNLQYLTAISAGMLLTTGINSVEASTIKNEQTSNSEGKTLISQLRGHDTFNGGSQMAWENYTLGRVIGKSGDILFIRTESGAVFHANGGFCPGSDVLVQQAENGRYYLVENSHPQWISRLKSKYGWKQVASSGALNERTAAIWASMGQSGTTTREIPPREIISTPAPTYTPQPEVQQQYNQPIRGLW